MRTLLTGLVLGVLATTSAMAAYTGPTAAPQLNQVSEILKNGQDDQPFQVTGYLVERLTDDEYRFADASGNIRADIDERLFLHVQVNEKTKVELIGTIDRDLIGAPELDVKILRVVQ